MTLIVLIGWLFIGGVLAWIAGRWSKTWPRWISLISLFLHLATLIWLWIIYLNQYQVGAGHKWFLEIDWPWIPQLGINLHLGLDGLSLMLVLLTNFLGIMAVVASWKEIQQRVGFFHFNLMIVLAALAGVFLSLDLFLFYFFWELMLVPVYFLIGIWGHENRVYASFKFFIFTQFSGLLMLLSILGLYFYHGQSSGVYTFDYTQLLGTQLPLGIAIWLMLGFFIAFAVKLPVFPLHTWLPDAHTEAPTAGSVDLAGLVLKVAGYGFIRFLIPLFPETISKIAPVAMALGVIGILYGAVLAFAQTDLKRLVAYTSISHMGFVLLGIFAMHRIALQGAVVIMLAHGISTGALFILVGALYGRVGTRDLNRMGGLWETVPRMGRVGLLFALASLGLPGLGNFVGEFLVLLGTYKTSPFFAILATLGFVMATVYSLWMVQRIFTGPNTQGWKIPDLDQRELAMMTSMIAVILWLGLYPQPVLNTTKKALDNMPQYSTEQAIMPEKEFNWPKMHDRVTEGGIIPLLEEGWDL
jgi:NADH-quinone oxidoreductase subunit M